MQPAQSRVFTNGNRQAVRIPQEFRLPVGPVEISRNNDGDLVLHAVPADRGAALVKALSAFDDAFAATLESQQREQPGMQDREAL